MSSINISNIKFHSYNETKHEIFVVLHNILYLRVKISFDTHRFEGTYNLECVDITTL